MSLVEASSSSGHSSLSDNTTERTSTTCETQPLLDGDTAMAKPSWQGVEECALADLPLLADGLVRDDEDDAMSGAGDADHTGKPRPPLRGSKASPQHEPKLTVREAIAAYPTAIFWSFAVSMCIIMEGYDAILIGNFWAFPQFQRKCELSTVCIPGRCDLLITPS